MLAVRNACDNLPKFELFQSFYEPSLDSCYSSDLSLSPPPPPFHGDMFDGSENLLHGLPSTLQEALQSEDDMLEVVSSARPSLLGNILSAELELFTCNASLFETGIPCLPGVDKTDAEDGTTLIKANPEKEDRNSKPVTTQAKRTSSRLELKRKALDEKKASCKMEKNEIGEDEINSAIGIKSRSPRTRVTDDLKDEKYWERRRRNNLAAKRSREAKRAYHMEVAQKTALLEKENAELQRTLQKLKANIKKAEKKLYGHETS